MSDSARNKRISKKREQAGAKQLGGKAHAGSGNKWNKKADFSNSVFLVEDKFTNADYYTLSLSVLQKLEKQAQKIGKTPVLRFGFEPKRGDFVAMRECYIGELINTATIVEQLSLCNKKSVRLHLDNLKKSYCNVESGVFFMSILLSDKTFYIGRWDDFVEESGYAKM